MAPMVEINGEPSHQVRSATTAAQFRRSLFRSADSTAKRPRSGETRRTKISAFLAASLRAGSTSQPNIRTMNKEMRRMGTSSERKAAGRTRHGPISGPRRPGRAEVLGWLAVVATAGA